MRTELEVARDAVRAALGDELADALEWAAKAVKHRKSVITAALYMTSAEGGLCIECRASGLYQTIHHAACTRAATLHALDPIWSEAEIGLAWAEASAIEQSMSLLHMKPSNRLARAIGGHLQMGRDINSLRGFRSEDAMIDAIGRMSLPRGWTDEPAPLLSQTDPARLTYSAGTAQFWPTPSRAELRRPPRPLFDIYDATRVTMADGTQYEKRQQANGDWEWEAVPAERADAGTTPR